MVVFIVPLKCRAISTSWTRVTRLLERTLASICAQTSGDFRVIVVCNEKPDIEFQHQNVEFVIVDIIPKDSDFGYLNLNRSRENDKVKRIRAGVDRSNYYAPSHIMVVDADDCINNCIVEFVAANAEADGWYSASGFVYKEGTKLLFKKKRYFEKVCGSCVIIRPELLPLLIEDREEGSFYRHSSTTEGSIALEPLPFPAAIYSIRNGENYHMTKDRETQLLVGSKFRTAQTIIRRLINYRPVPLTAKIRKQFGLYPIV